MAVINSGRMEKPMSDLKRSDWEAIYNEALPKVYNYFRFRIEDGRVAEDLTADTFEKAWRARGRYRKDISGFTTWVLAIARNVGIDYLRRRKTLLAIDETNHRKSVASAEEIVQQEEKGQMLFDLISKLPERERELISMKYGACMTNRKIAEITNLSETNVGTILNRVVHKLKKEWEQENEE
jgi:RNA polymerase sigma-70 factor (ECF subfamily)